MKESIHPDWNPYSKSVLEDQHAAYDKMRNKCPIAYSEAHQWSLFSYDDVLNVVLDHNLFSNNVSRFRSVPNGMDRPEHSEYRKAIEPFFAKQRISAFEPLCRNIARKLINNLPKNKPIEIIGSFAQKFSAQIQCAFLGWPESMQDQLLHWLAKNQHATFKQDHAALAAAAKEFTGYIVKLLQERRKAGSQAPDDVTTQLLQLSIEDRNISDEDIVSILRNWTAGEIGTISASLGIILQFLATHPDVQSVVRKFPEKLPEAIDEILRLHGPLISNRRIVNRSTTIRGRKINAGERISVMWTSANRDENTFSKANESYFISLLLLEILLLDFLFSILSIDF